MHSVLLSKLPPTCPGHNDPLLESRARARYSRRRQEEDDEEKEEEEISRGCVVEMNMVALTRASPYRRIITF